VIAPLLTAICINAVVARAVHIALSVGVHYKSVEFGHAAAYSWVAARVLNWGTQIYRRAFWGKACVCHVQGHLCVFTHGAKCAVDNFRGILLKV